MTRLRQLVRRGVPFRVIAAAAGTIAVLAVHRGLAAEQPPQVPTAPVIFLHYDYMVSIDPDDPHSHEPNPASVQMVVDAFRRRGITLHIDPRHSAIPEHKTLYWGAIQPGCVLPDPVTFGEIQAEYFHPAGNQPWHYVVFAHDVVADSFCWQVGGQAERPGYRIAIGSLFPQILRSWGVCVPENFPLYCQLAEGGTLMHELGHNLDLRHGGADDENYKPNYVSVMNYAFQDRGIESAAVPGDATPVSVRLDYSGRVYAQLDEDHLDEWAGIGGAPDDRDITLFSCFTDDFFCRAPAAGPIDWNLNGILESDVRQDINQDPRDFVHTFSVLRGFDDWQHVLHFLNTADYRRGLVRPRSVEP